MGDDGTGHNITIPALLISKDDGERIKEYYRQNRDDPAKLKNLILEIEFEMVIIYLTNNLQEHNSNIVNVDVYFQSNNPEIYKLLADFYLYVIEFGIYLVFTISRKSKLHSSLYYLQTRLIRRIKKVSYKRVLRLWKVLHTP